MLLNQVRTSHLDCGVQLVTETVPNSSSVSMGVWLGVGSRDETLATSGISHFFEHMAFKGTTKYTGLEIVEVFESSGGHVNAYTTKEHTCFYGKVVKEDSSKALDVLLQMISAPLLDPTETKKEKEVILEELRGALDSPDERAYDLLGSAMYPNSPLGFPIAGTLHSVKKLGPQNLKDHLQYILAECPIVIVLVGAIDHKKLEKQISEWIYSSHLKSRKKRTFKKRASTSFGVQHLQEKKDLEQANINLLFPAYKIQDSRCFAVSIVNTILGEGMSSRLFQKLREDHGLVYNINSFTEFMMGAGFFCINFSTDTSHVQEALKLVGQELTDIRQKGFGQKDYQFAQKYIRGNFLLEMENSSARMSFLAKMMLYEGKIYEFEKYLASYTKWSLPKVNAIAREMFQPKVWSSVAVIPRKMPLKTKSWLVLK